jgi:hypothetical protein
VLAKAPRHYRKQLKSNPRAVDYLKGRGLTGEIAARFGLGYSPDGWRGLASVFPPTTIRCSRAGLVIAHWRQRGRAASATTASATASCSPSATCRAR